MNKSEISFNTTKWADLESSKKKVLMEAPLQEWGHLPFMRETTWATPDYTIYATQNDIIISFVNLIEREVSFDHIKVRIAGISNLITQKEYRGQGLGKGVMKLAQSYFAKLGVESGLLLCSNELGPFYELLEWKKFGGTLKYNLPDRELVWNQNAFLFPLRRIEFPSEIHLLGYPW